MFAMLSYCERIAISGLRIKCKFFPIFFLQNKLPYLAMSYSKLWNSLVLVFCLFVCGFMPHSKILHSYGDVNFTGEGLPHLTYSRHSY